MIKIRHMSKKLDMVGLYLGDYGRKINGRAIAKHIKVSPQTALANLNELVKMNVLSFSTNGRNKDYRLNIENPAARQMVVLSENYKSLLFLQQPEIGSLIHDINGLTDSVVLFGSFASLTQDKESDIDIVAVGKFDKAKIKEVISIHPREINCEFVSFADFEKAFKQKKALAKEIFKNHVIFGDTDKIVDIFMRFLSK